MHQLLRYGCAGVLATVLVFRAAADIPSAAADTSHPAAEESAARGSLEFPHNEHVPPSWTQRKLDGTFLFPEVARDCRGCHDYGKTTEAEQVCNACHFNTPAGAKTLQVDGSVLGMRPKDGLFDHKDHLNVECRSCHVNPAAPQADVGKDIWMPERGPRGFSDAGWCVKCHDPSYQTQRSDPPGVAAAQTTANAGDAPQKFQKRLNASPMMAPSTNPRFSHLDHITAAKLGDAQGCDHCHASMREAETKDLGSNVFNETKCSTCHIVDATNKAQAFARGTDARQASRTDGTFYHSDHLRMTAEDPAAFKQDIGDQGCLACHQWAGTKGLLTTYGFNDKWKNEDDLKFADCLACHYHQTDRWNVDKFGPKHGEIDNCRSCHDLGEGKSMKKDRPAMNVARLRPKTFKLEVQIHPHIVGAKAEMSEKCSTCHVAEIKEMRSRIQESRFTHKSHLAANATAADCRACHTTIDPTSGAIQLAAGEGFRTYDLKACAACHKSVSEIQPSGESLESSVRPLFSHQDHLTPKKGKPLDCTECHDHKPGAAADRDFAFKENVVSCAKCHDHKEHWESTGTVKQDYVMKCNECHRVGVPRKKELVPMPRTFINGIQTAQFHPLPSEKKCGECHLTGAEGFADPTKIPATVTSDRLGYQKKGFHAFAGEVRNNCWNCHWDDLHDGEKNLTSLIPRASQTRPVDYFRSSFGNNLTNFPGGR